ncbi:hypothetical protein CEUSTIGMA_g11846.t1 [Chlamydomonas eustigma]|uniref:Uncharacterized protein n=1 Tax=Chlamydomonas eustigma TaxID=1157962 RepID=A0A250XMU8_9CHLO|nr:hypothetical protein CEUSTIGMA_g11846.t1 [Chlamydomonas eustigma]|eukprot:GAX84425.1 hypothetical protein CEUSTIGMA_g11846.t1 [Chlamydomonas eustigma]
MKAMVEKVFGLAFCWVVVAEEGVEEVEEVEEAVVIEGKASCWVVVAEEGGEEVEEEGVEEVEEVEEAAVKEGMALEPWLMVAYVKYQAVATVGGVVVKEVG